MTRSEQDNLLFGHHQALTSLLREYNSNYNESLSLGGFDECRYNQEDGRFSVPLYGASEMTYGDLIESLRQTYHSADIQYTSSTRYKSEHWVIVNVSVYDDKSNGYDPPLDNSGNTGCFSCLGCCCKLLIFMLVFSLCGFLIGAILLESPIINDTRVSSPFRNMYEKYQSGTPEFSATEDQNVSKGIVYGVLENIIRVVYSDHFDQVPNSRENFDSKVNEETKKESDRAKDVENDERETLLDLHAIYEQT